MTKYFKRALTSHQSVSCELAHHPRCTCRCQGLLHGIAHQRFMEIEQGIIHRDRRISSDQVADIIAFLKEP